MIKQWNCTEYKVKLYWSVSGLALVNQFWSICEEYRKIKKNNKLKLNRIN